MKEGYYWALRKLSYESEDCWSEPKPQFLSQEVLDYYEVSEYLKDTIRIISPVLTLQESERLKMELDECRKANAVLKRKLIQESSCIKGY